MDTNFLNALKQKADAIQSEIKKPLSTPRLNGVSKMVNNGSITDGFINAMETGNYTVKEIKVPGYNPGNEHATIVVDSNFGTENQTIHNEAIVTNIERIVNKNRIDVYFDKKPSDKLRHLLVEQSFRFNPDTKAWYMKDCKEACHFLETRLNVQGLSTIDKFKNESTETETVKSLPISENLASDFENDAYQQYKKQVNQLIDALKCDIADLPIIAIDCLYRQTFN